MPGHKNWIKYEEFYNNTSTMSFDFSSMMSMTKEETISNNIEKIYSDYAGKDVYVAFSGGMDSEFVVNSLKKNNKQFKVILVDYVSNRLELWYAHKWCYENNVVPEIYSFSTEDLFMKIEEVCEKYKCHFIGAVDYIIKDYVELRGGVLLGGGPEPFKRIQGLNDDLSDTMSSDLENATIYPKFCQITYNEHPFKFLMYTPEMLYNIVKEMDYTKPSQIALAEYYGVEPRPKIHFSHFWRALYGQKLNDKAIAITNKSYYAKLKLGTAIDLITAADNRQVYSVSNKTVL